MQPSPAALQTLEQIRATLMAALGSASMFSLVNTRVILRTGIDLNAIKPGQDRNPEHVGRVLEALTKMGFAPATLLSAVSTKAIP